MSKSYVLHCPLPSSRARVWAQLGSTPEELDAAEWELRDRGLIKDCHKHGANCVTVAAGRASATVGEDPSMNSGRGVTR